MHSLRHYLFRQQTGPSHEQTVQTTHDSSKASSPLPKGRYGPGNHVQDRVSRNDGVLRFELGNNPDNGKLTSGCLFMLAGGPLSFKTEMQNVTAQSTLEAELISMAHASKEAVYLSNMMAELGLGKLFESLPLFGDNTGALLTTGNSTYSSRTKHTALRFFYFKELGKDGKITIHHVVTQKQLADVGTKLLMKNTHRHLLNLIEAYTKINDI